MSTPTPTPTGTAFENAVTSRQHLEQALSAAGFDPADEFPLLNADLNVFGEGRIHVGPISLATAGRLCRAISGPADC